MGYAYVGCRTTRERNARGKGIKVFRIDEVTGDWTEIQCLLVEDNPSYQAMDRHGKYLYSVHGDISKISSYKILDDGTLRHLNTVDIGGRNPVYLTVDKTDRYLIVAALQGGAVYSLRLKEDGSIGGIADTVRFEGKKDGAVSFVHQCAWDCDGEYIFAPAQGRIQGYGQIRVFKFHGENGSFEETCKVLAREFAEPRHIAMHPNNKYVYLMNEKDNTVEYLEFCKETGQLYPRQILPTLPDTYVGEGQASTAAVDASGSILVGANRTFDTLVLYRINPHTGYLKTIGFMPTLGKTPRFMGFNREATRIYVANEDSDTIVEMKLDVEKGYVEYTGRIIATESPVCIVFK